MTEISTRWRQRVTSSSKMFGLAEPLQMLPNTGKSSDHCRIILSFLITIKTTNLCENGKMVIEKYYDLVYILNDPNFLEIPLKRKIENDIL